MNGQHPNSDEILTPPDWTCPRDSHDPVCDNIRRGVTPYSRILAFILIKKIKNIFQKGERTLSRPGVIKGLEMRR